MPNLVKIVRFHETGDAQVLRIDELPLPEPGPGEVRLRVKAIGLNRAEIMFREGQYFLAPDLPSKIGYEASGMVEAVGPGVDAGLVGQVRSTVPAFPLNKYGVYGEVAIVPASALAAYPQRLSFEEGTSIWMQYITAYGAIVHNGRIARGDHVVLTAATSSVGIAAIQIVKAEGGIAIATTRTSDKRDELLAAGADHVIVTNEESDVAGRIMAITNGVGAKIIFDAVAGAGLLELAKATARDALIMVYGTLAPEPTPFPVFEAWAQGAQGKPFRMMGYTMFAITGDPETLRQAERYVYEKLDSGQLKPRIDRTFPLADIVQAHRYMEQGQQIGKIVVTV
ncbi:MULTISPECIES: zinc-dependent alcohol dehydrogenase family protein [unclassified Pseudomonas]|uniref:zinc-dependent alcohol dehydrogenase family protein n=1 Tax=unclassified Pseudomonas TaxID=196821 RepID=UPI000731A54C|nr:MULTISPECIES: zinc-dependent alcohol dehydrogenase family protein [unclassified Pseudomonas]KSW27103.1 NADPH:quinone reductase [Pseudomonas sp. ADP]OBP09799.1 NADPH:quinone reductase [Pseudomonas sp. EGD-AKN5]QOF83765.1 zinc-dependent alcohol dehydrogenase family protein [Pseudomonas sp. ADPe]